MLSSRTRVDPRTLRTRALLQDAFRQLLAERSFGELTVQEIASRATVNRATFYAHFADKYELLDTLIDDVFAAALQRRLPPAAEGISGWLRQLLLAVMDHLSGLMQHCRSSYQSFEALIEARIKEQLRVLLHRKLAEQVTMRGQPAQRSEIAATLLSWSIYGAAQQWLRQPVPSPAGVYAAEVLALLEVIVATLDTTPSAVGD